MNMTITRASKAVACPPLTNSTAPHEFLKHLRTNSTQPMLAVLIGPPASGKSTFRDAYLADVPRTTRVFSTDDRIENWGRANGLDYAGAFAKVNFKAIEKEMFLDFETAARGGVDLIADRTNMTVGSRARWMNRLPDAKNWFKVAVVFDVPEDVLRDRLNWRAEQYGKRIPWDVVQKMVASYEAPSVEKEFDWVIGV